MLLTVLILAPAALGTGGAAWWFAAGSAVLFFARRPWEIWLQTRPETDATARAAALALFALGLGLGAVGLWVTARPQTAVLAVAAAALAALSAYTESDTKKRGAVAGRVAGAIAMVTLLLLQVEAAFGRITPEGWGLAALCFVYFLTSGLRVRSLVRARKVEGFRRVSLALHGAALVGAAVAGRAGLVPAWSWLGFAPGFLQAIRILGRGDGPVNTLRMGVGEILHASAFIALTVVAYRLGTS